MDEPLTIRRILSWLGGALTLVVVLWLNHLSQVNTGAFNPFGL